MLKTIFSNITSYFDADKILNLLAYDAQSPLLFNTGLFLVLFVLFILVYRIIRQYTNLRMIFVILFSLYFYYKSSAECCLILFGVCVSDYILGRLMGVFTGKAARKSIVLFNVLVNVGMLVYFKYTNLILSTFANFRGESFEPLSIILPAGISFFTFRSISYIVDIYRGKIEPTTNFLHYTFYLTFFPPLLAGPVVRASDMLPQIKANPIATRSMVSEGLFLIMAGLVKKVLIADYISGNFVDRIFDNPALYTGFENLMGIYGFTLQLYCDFSGYSDMAIGIALLIGYRFKDNFDSPFKSQSPTEYWRRWHISLSLWLRDYVYISMGGNRVSKWRANLNVFNTMVIGGLWHGASWMYLIWGAWNGLMLVCHKILKSILPPVAEENKNKWYRRLFNVLITFNLIAVGMMFFRARSMSQVVDMVHQIISNFHIEIAPQFFSGYLLIMLAMLLGYILHFTPHSWNLKLRKSYDAMPILIQAIIFTLVIYIIIQVRSSDLVPFIYLQY